MEGADAPIATKGRRRRSGCHRRDTEGSSGTGRRTRRSQIGSSKPCCQGFSSIDHGLRSSFRLLSRIAGLVALHMIPIAQFPDIVPPQVSVSVSYPGASAEVVQQSIAQPIESRVVGVDNAIYMKSTSGNDGSYTLTVSFAVGTDPDINTVNVQNRVNLALAQLPQEAQAQGISVTKKSSALMQLIALTSASGEHDQLFLSNYATINMIDGLKRIPRRGRCGAADAVGLQHAHLDHAGAADQLRDDAQ